MKILKNILKLLGLTSLVLMALLLVLVLVAQYMFVSDEKVVDSDELLKSTEFKNLHQSVISFDSIENIAVLPDENYVVINGTVINLAKQSFGDEPELGFYNSYYEEGDRVPYTSLDSLLTAKNIRVDSQQTLDVIKRMKNAGISDIGITKGGITYRWKVSAMYGEEGILYSKQIITKDSTRFDLFENIAEGFYHFAVYD